MFVAVDGFGHILLEVLSMKAIKGNDNLMQKYQDHTRPWWTQFGT